MHRIGIDIGRVIIEGDDPRTPDTSFIRGPLEAALRTPAVPGSIEAVARIAARFAGHAWLVSKCGARVEEKTRAWLEHHRFFERTALDPSHLRFCRRRPDKAIHCRELGLTHFVDDRLDVLEHLRPFVPHLYRFGPGTEAGDGWYAAVADWAAAEQAILGEARPGGVPRGCQGG